MPKFSTKQAFKDAQNARFNDASVDLTQRVDIRALQTDIADTFALDTDTAVSFAMTGITGNMSYGSGNYSSAVIDSINTRLTNNPTANLGGSRFGIALIGLVFSVPDPGHDFPAIGLELNLLSDQCKQGGIRIAACRRGGIRNDQDDYGFSGFAINPTGGDAFYYGASSANNFSLTMVVGYNPDAGERGNFATAWGVRVVSGNASLLTSIWTRTPSNTTANTMVGLIGNISSAPSINPIRRWGPIVT